LIAFLLASRPVCEPLRRPYQLASAAARTAVLSFCLSSLCLCALAQPPSGQGFTLRQVMSAPFDSDLTAAPAGDAFAWVSNAEGKRNLWVAVRSPGGEYVSHAITDYPLDDGQDISEVTWSPDAKSILYVRGGSSDNPEKRAPNPAHLPGGAGQDVWLISVDGGRPAKSAPAHLQPFPPPATLLPGTQKGRSGTRAPPASAASRRNPFMSMAPAPPLPGPLTAPS
jgi:dipeptidyl aminopeptidase/acylaminoacyl peptidase